LKIFSIVYFSPQPKKADSGKPVMKALSYTQRMSEPQTPYIVNGTPIYRLNPTTLQSTPKATYSKTPGEKLEKTTATIIYMFNTAK
jgi:hypothetical protein